MLRHRDFPVILKKDSVPSIEKMFYRAPRLVRLTMDNTRAGYDIGNEAAITSLGEIPSS